MDNDALGAIAGCGTIVTLANLGVHSRQVEELDMTFDPIAMYHQLMLAAGKEDFPVVPNTLDTALEDKKSAIVVTTAQVR